MGGQLALATGAGLTTGAGAGLETGTGTTGIGTTGFGLTIGAGLTTTGGVTTGAGAMLAGTEVMIGEQLNGTWTWPSPIWLATQVTAGGVETIVVTFGGGVGDSVTEIVGVIVEVMVMGAGVTTNVLVAVVTGTTVCVV